MLGLGRIGKPQHIVPTHERQQDLVGELLLYDPPTLTDEDGRELHKVFVDEFLCANLRPHQRDGVQFMFQCMSGVKKTGFYGCILSDGMGLGKTFQSIATIWTLLTKGIHGKPTCQRAIIVTPSSLVQNWGKELGRWLGSRIQPHVVEDTRADKVKAIVANFGVTWGAYKYQPQVLVLSYTTFRLNKAALYSKPIDLLVCDEAHMLKNRDSQVSARTGLTYLVGPHVEEATQAL